MGFVIYYIIAIAVLVLHFTGVLARYNMEWLVLAAGVSSCREGRAVSGPHADNRPDHLR